MTNESQLKKLAELILQDTRESVSAGASQLDRQKKIEKRVLDFAEKLTEE